MSTATTATLGLVFLGLALVNMFLMFHLWGYPFDKETRTSAAPKSLMITHRVIGYVFAVLYIVMMIQMVPRLWTYQVELPARTVVHLVIGFTIGFVLLVKIAIMRFFRHFEEWMPFLGTGITLLTVLLVGLSVPFVLKERAWAASAPGGGVYSAESLARVEALLPRAELPEAAPLKDLATPEALAAGRDVLLGKCVKCHDLKTILARPRAPSDWTRTVERMAEKPALFEPIDEAERWRVTAYLIAITPDIQRSVKPLREERAQKLRTLEAAREAAPAPGIDRARAREAFETVCSECHDASDVEDEPPRSAEDVQKLLERMVANGLEADEQQLVLVKAYLMETYAGGAPAADPP